MTAFVSSSAFAPPSAAAPSSCLVVVGVADLRVTDDARACIVTYSLGSCIGVTAYDPVARVGGMLHFQLPDSNLDKAKAASQPAMFADTGVQALLDHAMSKGARKTRLQIKLAGAAQIISPNDAFAIGRRNQAAIRKVLWQHGLLIAGQDLGGDAPRTLSMHLSGGAVTIRSRGETTHL